MEKNAFYAFCSKQKRQIHELFGAFVPYPTKILPMDSTGPYFRPS